MRRALLSGLVVTAVSAAGAVVSGAAVGEPAPAGAAAAAGQGTGTKTVTYRDLTFRVPSSWPVYDLRHEPSRCVRFDVHAVYLGHPGPEQACPARVRGRTDAVLVEPLKRSSDAAAPAVDHLAAPDPEMVVRESVSRQEQIAIRGAGVLMTVTYGASQAEAQKVVRSARLVEQSPEPRSARPSTPASSPTSPAARRSPAADDSSASGRPATSPPSDDEAADAPPMALAAHAEPMRASAGPLGPPRWVLGWSPTYGIAWYPMLSRPGPRRARPPAAPHPAPAPAPTRPESPRPHPTVTVTRTVVVPPPSRDTKPSATPSNERAKPSVTSSKERATPSATSSKDPATPSITPSKDRTRPAATPSKTRKTRSAEPVPSPSSSADRTAAPDDDGSPLPKPGVSFSKKPGDHTAKPETAKKDKDKSKDKDKDKSKDKKTKLRAARLTGKGFDACTAPSQRAMRAWHGAYKAANIYIGGAARACGDGNLSRSWVRAVRKAGWKLIPTYVGLQAPCGPYGSKIDPKRAAAQGRQSADDAISEAKSFGLTKRAPLYFDMEGYNSGNASCRKAVLSFIDGWTGRLHKRGHIAGVYGSVSSTIADLGRAYGGAKPDGVWFAHWDGKANTTSPYMRGGWWPDRQRIKQYRGTHYEKHGGVRLSVDTNRVDGYVY